MWRLRGRRSLLEENDVDEDILGAMELCHSGDY